MTKPSYILLSLGRGDTMIYGWLKLKKMRKRWWMPKREKVQPPKVWWMAVIERIAGLWATKWK